MRKTKNQKALAKMYTCPFICPYPLYYSSHEIINHSQRTSAAGSSIPYHASTGPPMQFPYREISPNWEYTLIL